MKKILDEKKIKYTEATANTSQEVIAAASSLIASKVDAVFTPTDNVIMSSELAIYETFMNANILHIMQEQIPLLDKVHLRLVE